MKCLSLTLLAVLLNPLAAGRIAPQDPATVKDSFFAKVSSLFPQYFMTDTRPDSQSGKSASAQSETRMRFNLKQNDKKGEHMIDITLKRKDNRFEVAFQKAKLDDLSKTFYGYYAEEMELHWDTLEELIKRMVHLDRDQFDTRIFYATMVDVKNAIIEASAGHKVEVEESADLDLKELSLRVLYEKTLVMTVRMHLEGPTLVPKTEDTAEKKDYNVAVQVSTSTNNRQEETNFLIPVFSIEGEEFFTVTSSIRNMLKYELFVNTRDNLVEYVKTFAQGVDAGVTLTQVKGETNPTFKLQSEAGEVLIRVSESSEGPDTLPDFTVALLSGSKVDDEVKVKRLPYTALAKTLTGLNLKKYVRTIYEEIMETFQKQVRAVTFPAFAATTVKEISPKQKLGNVVFNGGHPIVWLMYVEEAGVVTLTFKGEGPTPTHQHVFNKSRYSLALLESMFKSLLNIHKTVVRQKGVVL